MAAQNLYKMTTLKWNTTLIKGIEEDSIDGGQSVEMLDGGGNIDPFNFIMTAVKPRINFSTKDIATFLNTCGIDGLAIDGTHLWKGNYAKLAPGGTVVGSTTDRIATVNQGVMYMKSINAPFNKAAMLNAGVIPTFNGTDEPCVFSAGTMDALTRDTDAFFGGKVDFNGTAVINQGWNLEMNPVYSAVGSDVGGIYETEVVLMKRQPKFTIPIFDMSQLNSLGPLKGLAASTVSFYLRKQTVNGGGAVADASTVHIKLSCAVAGAYIENVTAQNGSIAQQNLVVIPVSNISTAIIVINTATAIS